MSLDSQEFIRELASLLNRHGIDNATHTPDFILADMLLQQLEQHSATVEALMKWHRWPSLEQRLFHPGGVGVVAPPSPVLRTSDGGKTTDV